MDAKRVEVLDKARQVYVKLCKDSQQDMSFAKKLSDEDAGKLFDTFVDEIHAFATMEQPSRIQAFPALSQVLSTRNLFIGIIRDNPVSFKAGTTDKSLRDMKAWGQEWMNSNQFKTIRHEMTPAQNDAYCHNRYRIHLSPDQWSAQSNGDCVWTEATFIIWQVCAEWSKIEI